MQAILYVAHGTRLQAGIDEAVQFIENQMKQTAFPIQTYSFIDLAKPSIEEGIESCIKQGATKIAIVPILLLAAAHVKEDIPESIFEAMEKYPYIQFTYGKPFGVNDHMIHTIIERIKEQGELDDTSSILLVGRGSSDPSICDDFAQIISKLREKTNVNQIEVCYLAAQKPNLTEGIAKQVKNDAKKVFVVPYLLFTGLLMRHLEEVIRLIDLPHKQFHLCETLGQTKAIDALLHERIVDAVTDGDVGHVLSSTVY